MRASSPRTVAMTACFVWSSHVWTPSSSFFFHAEDGIRDRTVTEVQTCALPISASDLDAPPVYAPWVDWLAQSDGKASRAVEELTADNWDDFYPAGRRVALADIRRSDPAKIGRASCRESGEIEVGGGAVQRQRVE